MAAPAPAPAPAPAAPAAPTAAAAALPFSAGDLQGARVSLKRSASVPAEPPSKRAATGFNVELLKQVAERRNHIETECDSES